MALDNNIQETLQQNYQRKPSSSEDSTAKSRRQRTILLTKRSRRGSHRNGSRSKDGRRGGTGGRGRSISRVWKKDAFIEHKHKIIYACRVGLQNFIPGPSQKEVGKRVHLGPSNRAVNHSKDKYIKSCPKRSRQKSSPRPI